MTLDELKELVSNAEIKSEEKLIESGILLDKNGKDIEYTIFHGWDLMAAAECNEQWSSFNSELFENIESSNYSEEELLRILSSIKTEDLHWDWFIKSCKFKGDEYEWFYLHANSKPQGACLIFHPKNSFIGQFDIFYVEFIAVAPWNRTSLIHEKELLGVGSLLLKAALKYSIGTLGLAPGFSLHSLPQSYTYYERLKMVHIKEQDKGELAYFEMPKNEANKLLEPV